MHLNLTQVHKQHSDTLWETPQTPSPHLQSTWETNRHHQTPKDTLKRHLSGHTSSNILFGCLGTSVDVVFCLLGFLVVLNCPEITGGGVWEHICAVCLWVMYASQGLYESSLNTVQALHGAAKFNIEILSERKNFNHLTLLQHPKTETSL